jgi:DNA-binding MarR family transcriptional regulator
MPTGNRPTRRKVPLPPAGRPDKVRAAIVDDTDTAELMKAFRRMARAIDVRSKAISRAAGLTIPQIVILQAARDLGEVTTGALSRHVDLSAATVITILDKLEARGLIERYRSPSDRRIVHSRLTGDGRALLATAPALLPDGFRTAFAGLPAARRRAIAESFAWAARFMGADSEELLQS